VNASRPAVYPSLRSLLIPIALAVACASIGGCGREAGVVLPQPAEKPKPGAEPDSIECAEIQVFPRVPGEPVQRLRPQGGHRLRLSRAGAIWTATLPAGSSVGRTEQTNDYVGEQLESVHAERTASFDDNRYVVHCLAQPTSAPPPGQ